MALQDFEDLEKRQALYKAGRDKLGRQVVVFTLYNLGEKVDFERLLLYIIKVMDKVPLAPTIPSDGSLGQTTPHGRPCVSHPSRASHPSPFSVAATAVGRVARSWWKKSTRWSSARRT